MSSAQTWQMDGATSSIAALHEQLWNYFHSRVQKDDDVADELTQQTWLSGARFRNESSRRFYLFSVAHRILASFYRRRYKDAERLEPEVEFDAMVDDDGVSIATLLDDDAANARLRAAVEQLPAPFREVMELSLAGLRGKEIAEALGISYHTVRSRLSRGTSRVREMLVEERNNP